MLAPITGIQQRRGFEFLESEAISSAISIELFSQNCRWVEGSEAVEILAETAAAKTQRVQYTTRATRRILDRYEFARAGGWIAYGSTLDGKPREVAYFKPLRPRLDFESRKRVKYETPAGCPATPLLPWVSWEQGLAIASKYGKGEEYRERILQENRSRQEASQNGKSDSDSGRAGGLSSRLGRGAGFGAANCPNSKLTRERAQKADDSVAPEGVDRGFYRWLETQPKISVAITEGWKKALALVEHGIPAIALRGVTCWHPKGSPELWSELAAFATSGRSIHIVFDADTKEKAIRNVSREIKKLGRTLEAQGCQVSVVGWDPELGKGIDDVLAAKGDEAERWLNQKIATAATFEEWNKRNLKAYRLRVWRWLRSTGIEPERITTGRYLSELPELQQGTIHILTAPMGSGKTERLKDWVQSGYFVLCLSPLNSLGKQSAERWGLPHRHDCGNSREQQEAFRLLVREAGGVVACVDSLSRLQEFIDESTPLLIVLDEADQVLESLNLGGTLGERQAETLETFAANLQIAARNGAIVLSEACVSRRSIQQIQELSGCSKVRYFQHHGESQPWTVSLSSGGTVDNFAYELVNTVGNGEKVILTVSSQNQGEKLERLVNELCPNKRTLRIDSKTNEAGAFDQFWLDPDSYLSRLPELPDLLVLSPSAKSGVSIAVPGFDQVWGLFTCHSPSSWAQQLGRYRLPVERFVFCPVLIPASTADEGYCSVRAVERRLQADLTGFARVYDLAAALDQDEQASKIAQSQRDFYSDHQTAIGIEKAYPRDCLSEILSEQGHAVIGWIPAGSLGAGVLARIQREIWQDEAELFAEARPDFDLDEAKKRLGSSELTRKGRAEALKVLYRDEFPGIDFDDPADCYAALTENFGRLRRGVLLQVQAANLDATKRQSSQQVEAILRGRVQLAHRLPKSFFRAALIKQLGLLELLDGNPYQESDKRVQRIKTEALYWAREIYKNFTLSIRADQTGIEIANKLLRKLALKAEVLRKVGRRGEQARIWGLPQLCDPIRVRLLKAATERIGGDPNSILIEFPKAFYEAAALVPPLEPELADWKGWIDCREPEDFDYFEEPEESD